jgi:ADP-heptose:LPS heptosyltransferase
VRARVTVLEDVAFRVDGLRFFEHLPRSVANGAQAVTLDLSACSVAEGMWALPALEAIAAQLPRTRFEVQAERELEALLRAHLEAKKHRVARSNARSNEDAGGLVIELAPRFTMRPRILREDADRHRIVVPSRPFPKRRQHAWGHWVDGARACGFDAVAARPKLRFDDPGARRSAREWRRERFGRRGRTLVALLPSPRASAHDGSNTSWGIERFAALGRVLEARLGAALLCRGAQIPGAIALDELDIVTAAHVLAVAAVAIGDADGLVHVAAAAGSAAVSLHGDAPAEERGVASELGAAISADRCRCEVPRAGCLACIAPARVADVAERLAGQRWPWDRIAQL